MTEKSVSLGVRRGLGLRCPHCGEGRLYRRYLKVQGHCESCGADNSIYPSDDAPPYLTLFLVGHLLLPFMFWMDKVWEPAIWVMLAIWLPAVAIASALLLPYMKGLVVGFAWANNVTR